MPVDDPQPWLAGVSSHEDQYLLLSAESAFRWALTEKRVFGLAVSGGSDSMAMLHLMARAAPHSGWRVEAATVDHRLRPEAEEEAGFVAQVCAGLGVPHETLVWEDHPQTGNLMQAASRARYRLMAEWAKGRGIGHVAVAHTADDQAETFLIGLARAAGLDGLAGMRRSWTEGGVTFHRPFLHQTRAELRGYLTRHGPEWREDPSNDNDRYTRVKARRALKALKPLGITVDRLASSIHHLHMALGVVRGATAEAFEKVGREEAGAIVLDRKAFRHLDPELCRRLLVAALRWLSGSDHPPRAEALFRVWEAIRQRRDATLSGCRIRVTDTEIRIAREPRAVAALTCPTTAPWDSRWHLDGPHAEGLEIRALGAEGLRLCPHWRDTGLPRDALLVTPAVWRDGTLIAAPLAGRPEGWSAQLRPSFAGFLHSH